MESDRILTLITQFLENIGIKCRFDSFSKDSFLPGVAIEGGNLVIDKEKLLYPGDLLHEAGHIAVEPGMTRSKLNDNVRECGQGDGEEMAAIAWSWAALSELNLPPDVVFHSGGYKGYSESVVDNFTKPNNFSPGELLLSTFGMCAPLGSPDGFPQMYSWLRI